jgi:hypothetical protein
MGIERDANGGVELAVFEEHAYAVGFQHRSARLPILPVAAFQAAAFFEMSWVSEEHNTQATLGLAFTLLGMITRVKRSCRNSRVVLSAFATAAPNKRRAKRFSIAMKRSSRKPMVPRPARRRMCPQESSR